MKKKNIILYEEQALTNMPKDEQAQGRTDFGMKTQPGDRLRVSLRQKNAIAAIDISNKKIRIPLIDALIKFISIFRC